jgi:hypothetical protein
LHIVCHSRCRRRVPCSVEEPHQHSRAGEKFSSHSSHHLCTLQFRRPSHTQPSKMNQNAPLRRSAAITAVGMLLLTGNAVFGFQAASTVTGGRGVRSSQQMTLAVSTLTKDWDVLSDFEDQRSFALPPNTIQGQHPLPQWMGEDTASSSAPAEPQHHHPQLPPLLELPNKPSVWASQPTAMSSLEVTVGRASMVAALFLLVNELATGQSLPTQLAAVATSCLVVLHP